MNVETLLDSVRADLTAQATPQFRASILRFFREPVDPYGVRTAAVRKIAAAAFREFREWPLAQRNRFCNELWKNGKVEERAIAVLLYSRFRKQCAGCEFRLFEKWLDRYIANWAHCDAVSCMLLAAALENEPSLLQSLPPWTASPNRWKRRAAAVSLVPGAR